MRALNAVLLLLLHTSVVSFAPHSALRQRIPIKRPSQLNFTPDDLGPFLNTLKHAHEIAQPFTSVNIADATAAVEEGAKSGWWEQYLSLMKSGLTLVHTTITPTLNNLGISRTWGPSIMIFTLTIRSLLIPLSIQQTKSAEMMKALKPYQNEIKEKFADNKDMQNRALSKLFEDANQNPLSGCLFSLLQLPIFLGLYRSVTLLAKDGVLDEGFLWIPSLQGPVSAPNYRGMDWLTSNFDMSTFTPALGWETTSLFLVMPILLVLLQGTTMKILTPEQDKTGMTQEEKDQMESTQRVLQFLPLMIGYFSLQVPAGLTIYWASSNVFTLAQSLAVKAYYKANPPKVELPDYWDAIDDVANMSEEQRREAAKAGISTGPKFEDLMDEAMFHYVVDREEVVGREWREKVGGNTIDESFKGWVGAGEEVSGEKETEASSVVG